jgi:hypothetical protein
MKPMASRMPKITAGTRRLRPGMGGLYAEIENEPRLSEIKPLHKLVKRVFPYRV